MTANIRAWSAVLIGAECHTIEVEAHLRPGRPSIYLDGLPPSRSTEVRDRVRAAVINSGQDWPDQHVTVSLRPHSLPKHGSGFDLAMAVAVLTATGSVPAAALNGTLLLAELGLDGRLHPVPGVVAAARSASGSGLGRIIVSAANADEAGLAGGCDVISAGHLRDVITVLRGEHIPIRAVAAARQHAPEPQAFPAARIPAAARHAVEVCAAGGHNLWMVGPAGSRKPLIAEYLAAILPDLEHEQALETASIHSAAGLLPDGAVLTRRPPLQAPHHTVSEAALIGGRRPGAVSLAHNGVLFLDDAPEFGTRRWDLLRQPLTTRQVTIVRAGVQIRMPARFQLVLAAASCPCAAPPEHCTCTSPQNRYLGTIQQPVGDRLEVRLPLNTAVPSGQDDGRDCARSAERVAAARERSAGRLQGTPWRVNADISVAATRGIYRPSDEAIGLLETAMRRGEISGRGATRAVRLAWTLSDLAGLGRPGIGQTAAALELRDPSAFNRPE